METSGLSGHDSVITIGGVQSNLARATALAARQLGLEPFLILRTECEDLSLVGNLLFDRMIGAEINTVTPSTYARIGSDSLLHTLAGQLKKERGLNPYIIPVGGSNSIGCFGYIDCIDEIVKFCTEIGKSFDHIVFACGSGGTAAGICIGARLSGLGSKIHAVGVCDSPDYFYHHIDEVATQLNIDPEVYGNARDWCFIHRGEGIGCARSTPSELDFIVKLSCTSGIILDPVYSGKALYYFKTKVVPENPSMFLKSQSVLFIHTGGTFGLYAKESEILPHLPQGKIKKMNLFS